jgi:diguanylate cyclase (GGDEF)-like protein
MSLDIRTIVVMLLVSAVLMTVTLSLGIRGSRAPGLGKWNIGLGLFALGWLLIAARDVAPRIIGVALADALLLGGLCFQLAALYEFDRRAAPRWLLAVPVPLLFVLVAPLLDNYAALTLLTSAAYAAAIVSLAVFVLKMGSEGAGPVRWLMAPILAAGAIAVMLRAVDIALAPDAYPGMFASNALHTAAFIMLFAITVTSSFAFLVMQTRRTEAGLHHLAMFDPLTELFNRRGFIELAERELARARRARLPCAMLMMDLDHFKRVNDEFGHLSGDRVLAEFAAVVKRSLRTEDLAGRYGGEEFCAVLYGTQLGTAIEIANRIRTAASERPLGGIPRAITVSIGVALCLPEAAHSLDASIARADEALYQAKQAGRNRVVGLEGAAAQGGPDIERNAGDPAPRSGPVCPSADRSTGGGGR